MSNPLLQEHTLPPFEAITAEHIAPALDALIADYRQVVQQVTQAGGPYTWDNLVAPLEAAEDRLDQAWSPVSHLNAVKDTPEFREAYNACVLQLTEFSTEMGQNSQLYQAYQALADSDEYAPLSVAQKKAVDNALRDFHLSGVDLPAEKKQRYGEIKKRSSELSTQFSNNVLDATQAWYKHITDKKQLAGLPDSAIAQAEAAAKTKSLSGYVITLDIPAYLAVMTHADSSELRADLYRAFCTRASAEGKTHDGNATTELDNTAIIEETLALRHEQAQLLGFKHYSERSLATKMAQNPQQVQEFLHGLAEQVKPIAERDLQQLKEFSQKQYGINELQPWDITYYSEKLKQHEYAISQEELRPYFPAEKVIDGLFTVAQKLFGIRIQRNQSASVYHSDVHYYEIFKDNQLVASFYFDLFARDGKRGGAWMADCRVRRRTPQGLQNPVAFLTCNFTPPIDDTPSLLTHNEVTTLFHEFGHGLHHMLTAIDVAAVSGINGVAWDAVELPSQFLENWCWQKQVIPLISGHYQTGEPLPEAMLDKMLAAKNFQSGLFLVRQLEFALFDFTLHSDYQPQQPQDPQAVIDSVREKVAVLTPPSFNKFQNSFSHIFAGGYAAGYYSYLWAEVLSADAFSLFEEQGIFDPATGRSFLTNILQKGGSQEPMELFKAFRGREPKPDALLRHSGIVTEAA